MKNELSWWKENFGDKFKAKMYKILYYLFPVILLFIIYLFFSFIAWSMNPMDWWLVRETMGRVVFAFLFISYVVSIAGFYLEE